MGSNIIQLPRYSFDDQSVNDLVSHVLLDEKYSDNFVRESSSEDVGVSQQRRSTANYGYERGATAFHQIFCHQTSFFDELKDHTGLHVASRV